jgi:hypothetical protein
VLKIDDLEQVVVDLKRHACLEVAGRDNCHGQQANRNGPIREPTSHPEFGH